MNNNDRFFEIAINEAKKGLFTAHPNPIVGAVIVKNGKILSTGYHKLYGKEHAEVSAIKKLSSKDLNGSTLYVTLEPCSSYGKTPPCTDLIIRSRISKVVIGSIDPNPLHKGKGIEILKRNNIKVEMASQEIQKKCKELNKPFFKNMIYKMPYVILKVASSIDGKIANKYYMSKWITSKQARKYSHRLRALSDCILVGANTVIKDDPLLNVRHIKVRKQPDIAIIDPELKISLKSRLFSIDRRFFIFTNKVLNFSDERVKFINLNKKRVELFEILKVLYENNISTILVEGGGITTGSFIKEGLFDKICWFISGVVIGKDGINSVNVNLGLGKEKIGINLKIENIEKIGSDLYVELIK